MIIEPRFNGPAGSGNGGYTAGLVAAELGGAAEVTLRTPPPLGTPLQPRATAGGIEVYAGERLVAEAVPVSGVDGEPPPPVGYAQAEAAAAAYPGLVEHPFPTCYVCGPQRAPGDGLRIFPGPVPGGSGTAAPWQVPGQVRAETVWAALDCPGGWAIIGPGRAYVLGRIAAQVHALPEPGQRCVAVGAVVASEGRKAQVRSALYTAEGGLLAYARATWIAVEIGT